MPTVNPLTVIVTTALFDDVEEGLNTAVAPTGKPVAEKTVVSLNPKNVLYVNV